MGNRIFEHLEAKLDKKYSSYYKVFIFDEIGHDTRSNLTFGGIAKDINSKTVILFANNIRPNLMLTHELLHGMGLFHSFNFDSKFSYVAKKTNNIMDYSYQDGKSAIEAWQWQWAELNSSLAAFIKPKSNLA